MCNFKYITVGEIQKVAELAKLDYSNLNRKIDEDEFLYYLNEIRDTKDYIGMYSKRKNILNKF